ncbi:nuclear protein localization protein 4 [Vanrija albida]|uniref:Nuclear protein localization protein 4 n=1 Tax=Vanrija albida TaxID=181172 RepID=A0ABR3Q7L7_9TREE
MLLRIRSPAGTARITVEPTTSGEDLTAKILETIPKSEPQPDLSTVALSNQPGIAAEKVTLDALKGRKVSDMGFSHGDLLFLSYKPVEAGSSTPSLAPPPPAPTTLRGGASAPSASTSGTATPSVVPTGPNLDHIVEPDIDVYWNSQSGKIDRKRDNAFCRHGEKAMCDYCMPLEPYDPKYQAENQIKHLSFHAYLRKLLAGRPPSAASSSYMPPLTPLSLGVLTPCPSGSHAPFPEGICSKCQPSALTLQSQSFRMVDHVEFATPAIIDELLSAWRRTGTQRFGFLIGRYDKYEKVPMGVKAVVEAVWEPQQEGEIDGLTIETPWEDEKRVGEIAAWCQKGLGVVGMIYTDLTPDPEDITKTLYKRHAQSYTASGLEMLASAQYQVAHPLATKASPTGSFSSRFVTCCLTGTEEGGIDATCWQATEQAEAMVKANTVEGSVDPSVVRVRKPGDGEYIPEVFYSFKNEYGIQVKMPAKPTFPVEYLFVNVTHGFPVDPDPLFLSTSFPVENRPGLHTQSLEVVIRDLLKILGGSDLEVSDTGTWPARIKKEVEKWLSDWHLVTFLCLHGSFSTEEQKLIGQVATAHANPKHANSLEKLFHSPGWQTLLMLAESSKGASAGFGNDSGTTAEQLAGMGIASPSGGSASAGRSGTGTPAAGADVGGEKACPHCTFINEPTATDCMVCGLPL